MTRRRKVAIFVNTGRPIAKPGKKLPPLNLAATLRPSTPTPPSLPKTHPKVTIVGEGVKVVVPYAPTGATLAGLADVWEVVARPGRKALVLHTGKATPTMSVTLFLAHKDPQKSVDGYINSLRRMSASKSRVTLTNVSPAERGPWRITDHSIEILARQNLTNSATRASVSLTLTEATDPVKFRGPVSGGKKGKGRKKAIKYKVKKGDTLRKLADRFFGSPSKWKVIAKANKIKKATATLKPGRVLTIPPNVKPKKGKKPKKPKKK